MEPEPSGPGLEYPCQALAIHPGGNASGPLVSHQQSLGRLEYGSSSAQRQGNVCPDSYVHALLSAEAFSSVVGTSSFRVWEPFLRSSVVLYPIVRSGANGDAFWEGGRAEGAQIRLVGP